MTLSPRNLLAAVALASTAACLDTTLPYQTVTTHTLFAQTNNLSASDSIQCIFLAVLPLPDSIRTPWTGSASFQIRRIRQTPSGPFVTDTIANNATINLTRGTGDSLNVAISGAFSLVLAGRLTTAPYQATGNWQCNDQLPLKNAAPGHAAGVWSLTTDRL